MRDSILVLNAGSSSLKFSVFLDRQPLELYLRGQFDGLLTQPRFQAFDLQNRLVAKETWPESLQLAHAGAIDFLFSWGRQGVMGEHQVASVGHRVVHGGVQFQGPVRVDANTLSDLDSLTPLAPLHQPHNVAAIRAVTAVAPEIPQVACFDTAFHRTQPDVAQAFGLPRVYFEKGLRRYGFHGLSYEYITSVLSQFDPIAAAGRTIVAHLGSGASCCAMAGGRSVATTMGFTALDGLLMGTRCGALDPGVLLFLMDQRGMDARALEKLLYQQSGLLGVSEISNDMRTLLASDDPRATAAVDLFVYRISRELGSLAAALGGLDALVFTGGIGEHAPQIRERIGQSAAWLGVELDSAANELGGPRISRPESRVAIWVIPTNEEQMIAQHTQRLVGGERSRSREQSRMRVLR